MNLTKPWGDLTYVGFDIETTGKYPLAAEVCEIGAVKWCRGEVIDRFQTLVKPTQKMGKEVIEIHRITNEMVENAPLVEEVIEAFHDFIQKSILIAHHAPFDLGFLSVEIEKKNLQLPTDPVICSSLLSRNMIPESPNHRLQTLIGFMDLERGQAHRAYDDANACLHLALKCMERMGEQKSLEEVLKRQGGALHWQRFSVAELCEGKSIAVIIVESLQQKKELDIVYRGGSRPGRTRRVYPQGLVRNLNGDFLVASEQGDLIPKRYFLEKISEAETVT